MGKLLAIFQAIAAFFSWLNVRAREGERAEDRQDGKNEAALETGQVIGDIADEQARINARRDSAGDVARQLRDEAAAIEKSRGAGV